MLTQTLKRVSWYNFYVDMSVKMSKKCIWSFETLNSFFSIRLFGTYLVHARSSSIDCWLTLICCTFQLMVALVNHLLTYLLSCLCSRCLFFFATIFKKTEDSVVSNRIGMKSGRIVRRVKKRIDLTESDFWYGVTEWRTEPSNTNLTQPRPLLLQ